MRIKPKTILRKREKTNAWESCQVCARDISEAEIMADEYSVVEEDGIPLTICQYCAGMAVISSCDNDLTFDEVRSIEK